MSKLNNALVVGIVAFILLSVALLDQTIDLY
jgi:hypothetical protein